MVGYGDCKLVVIASVCAVWFGLLIVLFYFFCYLDMWFCADALVIMLLGYDLLLECVCVVRWLFD